MKARLEFATAIRRIARTASLISIGFILMFLIGDRFNPANVRPAQWVGLAFFPVGGRHRDARCLVEGRSWRLDSADQFGGVLRDLWLAPGKQR